MFELVCYPIRCRVDVWNMLCYVMFELVMLCDVELMMMLSDMMFEMLLCFLCYV